MTILLVAVAFGLGYGLRAWVSHRRHVRAIKQGSFVRRDVSAERRLLSALAHHTISLRKRS